MDVRTTANLYYDAWMTRGGDMTDVPLAEDFVFTGPVASFDTADGFRAMAKQAGAEVRRFQVRHQFVDHLQLVDTDQPGVVELKNMAVREDLQGLGIGARLVRAAVDLVAAEATSELVVATAAADISNLRFYQRQGFRMRAIERDAFTPPPPATPRESRSTASNYATGSGWTTSSPGRPRSRWSSSSWGHAGSGLAQRPDK